MKKVAFLILIIWFASPNLVFASSATNSASFPDLFNEVCALVDEHFFDPVFIQEKFPAIKTEFKKKSLLIKSSDDFSKMVNTMLGQFGVSHTYYLTSSDYEYYHLASVFSFLPPIQALFNQQDILYPTIGIITITLGKKEFIAAVLAGSVAEQAGLLSGDEIVGANGLPYKSIVSLKEHIGTPVIFAIKRHPDAEIQHFAVTPVLLNPKKEMLEAQKASIQVVENQGKKIGYIHIYSYAGVEYHQELVSAISWGTLNEADALVIDLRYGLGGADPSYLNVFNTKVPIVTMVDNKGETHRHDPQLRKPTVLLVNGATRSGKEIMVFGAKKYQLATVIGEQTAGATLGARLFPISNGDFLYLAGRTSNIDNVDLEGVGVTPDIEVPMDIRYQAGRDIQRERAIDYLVELLKR